MTYHAGDFDVAVIGAGHAGIEAALAAARLGCETVVFTINMDAVGNCPCNPCIGGTAKGHLVRECGALGGEIARAADACCLQSRMLNVSKGPAVHSLRMQIDRRAYQAYMKFALEREPRLLVRQAEVVDVRAADGRVTGVVTHTGAVFGAKAVIVASGTYLASKIFVGEHVRAGGPDGLFPAASLSGALTRLGVRLQRFKTGTPARVNRRSLDFSRMARQDGDEPPAAFSFYPETAPKNEAPCWLTYTNAETHRIIRENLHRSPLFAGHITGTGTRYCPSIEDKVVKFAQKERHQLFLEPMGRETWEMYVQGMSSSLPEDVQLAMMRTVPGMEHVAVMRPAYAIEYDCCDPLQLLPTLRFRDIPGLWGAGQFNGTSGYEEAAAQGLVAGINAALAIKGEEPLTLPRSSSYIGTLIDDLVTKGTAEPYRMMTSRSEFRLLLRQDNADERLTPHGRRVGLIGDARWAAFQEKQALIAAEEARLRKTALPATEALNARLAAAGTSPVAGGVRMAELLTRPQVTYEALAPFDAERPALPRAVWREAELRVKYAGYIEKQRRQVEAQRKLERLPLPPDVDYTTIRGVRLEAQQKLNAIRPQNIGQAARISGVSSADIAVLCVWLKRQ